MSTSFRQKLSEKHPLIGLIVTLPAPETAEILCKAGFDWLFVDMEHSALDALALQRILQAAGPGCPCIARLPSDDEGWIKKALDAGTAGIIVPHVKTARQAEEIVRRAKYPPMGERSVGVSRAQGYGLTFESTVKEANDTISVIVQIEEREAVNNVDAITSVSGVDAVFIGPYDLSGSMGKLGQVDAQDVQEGIETVRFVCQTKGLPVGVFCIGVERANAFAQAGFDFIAVGIDTLYLIDGVRATLNAIRRNT